LHTFHDAAGRSWTIHLTLGTAMAVKDKLGIDLLQPEILPPPEVPPEVSQGNNGVPLITRLGTDEMLLGEVICCLLENQFETHKVTVSDVRQAFDGKTLLNAQKAFYEELVDFFQGRGRSDRAKAVITQQQLIDAAVKAATSQIDVINVDEMVQQALPQEPKVIETNSGVTSGGGGGVLSGNLLEPLGSTPDP